MLPIDRAQDSEVPCLNVSDSSIASFNHVLWIVIGLDAFEKRFEDFDLLVDLPG